MPKSPEMEPFIARMQSIAQAPDTRERRVEMVQTLAALEELLMKKLELLDQMQRLEQTPDEELSPGFRDMAEKYFELLSKTSKKSADTAQPLERPESR